MNIHNQIKRPIPFREHPAHHTEKKTTNTPIERSPEDGVTLSPNAQRGSATEGMMVMLFGILAGGGIGTAAPIIGGAIAVGSIFAGLALAS